MFRLAGRPRATSAAIVAVFALLLTSLSWVTSPTPAAAASLKGWGVQNLGINGNVAATGWAGTWRVWNPETNRLETMICVEWHKDAPDSEPGAYTFHMPHIDPVMAGLSAILGEVEAGVSAFSNDDLSHAALAIASKYRQAQYNAPGGVYPYTPAPGFPSGPADFMVTHADSNVANQVAARAFLMYLLAYKRGALWELTLESNTAHPSSAGGSASATFVLTSIDGTGVRKPLEGVSITGGATNATVTSSSTPTGPVPGAVGVTDTNGRVTFTATVTNPFAQMQIAAGTFFGHDLARTYAPVTASQQLMMAAMPFKTMLAAATLNPTLVSASVQKVTTNPSYQSGAGAVWEVRSNPGGVLAGTLTVGASGVSNALTVLPGSYRATETGVPAGQTVHAPIDFTASASGTPVVLSATNGVLQQATLTLEKLDAIDGRQLAGAGYVVRRDGNNDGVYGTADPSDSVGGAGFSGSGPYGPGPDKVWGTGDDVATSLSLDGVIPGPGLDGVYGTGDDDGLWYSSGDASAPTVIGPLWAGNVAITEVVQPVGYLPPAAGPGPDGLWGTGDDEDPSGLYQTQHRVLSYNTASAVTFANKRILEVSTQATVKGGNVGTKVADDVLVNGLHDTEEATVTVTAYGPYAPGTALPGETSPFPPASDSPLPTTMACLGGEAAFTETFTVTGSGIHRSPVFETEEFGVYTWVAEVSTADGRTATHDCGVASESFRIVDVLTKAKTTVVSSGEGLVDTVIVKGLAPNEPAAVTVELFGPFEPGRESAGEFADLRPSRDDNNELVPAPGVTAWKCDAENAAGSVTFTVTGDGEFDAPEITAGVAGVYTFTESLAIPAPGDGVATHPCGLAPETARVVNLATKASASEILAGDEIRDIAIVEGLTDDEEATVHVELFGPFNSASEIVCSADTLSGSASYKVTGDGEHPSDPFRPEAAGVYSFVETLELSTGEKVTHDCGLVAETFTVKMPATATSIELARTGSSNDLVVIGGAWSAGLGFVAWSFSVRLRRREL